MNLGGKIQAAWQKNRKTTHQPKPEDKEASVFIQLVTSRVFHNKKISHELYFTYAKYKEYYNPRLEQCTQHF